MSTRRSIEKERMSFVFNFVRDSKNGISDKTKAKKFEAYVQKVPSFIMTNGLGNTLAYLTTQTDEQWKNVQKVVCEWLKQVDNPIKERLGATGGKLENVLEIMKDDSFHDREYRAVTVEILALLNWLRRFAKAHRLTFQSKSNNDG
jgi:CRISPR-associated protein Cmr5